MKKSSLTIAANNANEAAREENVKEFLSFTLLSPIHLHAAWKKDVSNILRYYDLFLLLLNNLCMIVVLDPSGDFHTFLI